MTETTEALLNSLFPVTKVNIGEILSHIDKFIYESGENFQIYNQLLLIADDYLADCQYNYDKRLAMTIIQIKADWPNSVLEKMAKHHIVDSGEMVELLRAEKLQRDFKMRRDNAEIRHNEFKRMKKE